MRRTGPPIPPWLRHLYAAPRGLYAAGLGRLLGHRFLCLTHVGRRSGRTVRTILEVVSYDSRTGEAVVLAGYGHGAHWVRNVLAGGPVSVDFGRGPRAATHRVLGAEEAAQVYLGYEARHRWLRPVVRRVVGYFLGRPFDGSPEAVRAMVVRLPMLAFRPAGGAVPAPRPDGGRGGQSSGPPAT